MLWEVLTFKLQYNHSAWIYTATDADRENTQKKTQTTDMTGVIILDPQIFYGGGGVKWWFIRKQKKYIRLLLHFKK